MLPRIWMQRLPFKASLWNGVVRSTMTHMSPLHLQAMFPSTLETYKTWISRTGSAKGFQERVQSTDAGKTNILWLETAQNFEKVILFFHGGGYVIPLSYGHIEWMAHLQEYMASQGVRVGIAIVEYVLAPAHPYPAQLSQAVDAFQTLIAAGFQIHNIVIGGDSAGGHLTLPEHQPKHDHTTTNSAVSEARRPTRLPAAFVVSPLCSLDVTRLSYKARNSVDMLSSTIVQNCGRHHLDGSSAHVERQSGLGWSMPLDMGKEDVAAWWNGLDMVVANVLVTVGQEEVFRDHCIEFAEVLKDIGGKGTGFKATLLLRQDEAHDAPLFDFSAGRPPSATTTTIEQFVCNALMIQ
ncbi:hypothetical protein SVAN01_07630 [Stagonosporopsis vannaccii]|nr:hypothetical protein SVAN01_07630 [Stagonosporopsis vannaccii]